MKQISSTIFFCLSAVVSAVGLWLGVSSAQDSAINDVEKPQDYYQVILENGDDKKATMRDVQEKVRQPLNAPLVMQYPELPRGCEVASLTMLLQAAGLDVNKMTLAKEIKKDPTPYHIVDGKVHFGNPNVGFVGSMYKLSQPGFGVYHIPVARLAARYLNDRVIDLSGKDFSAVEDQLDMGKPVWVIVSTTFTKVPANQWMTWYTKQGEIRVTKKEHSVLLTDFDDQWVYFNDPLVNKKNRRADKSNFVAAWRQFGSQAISYKE